MTTLYANHSYDARANAQRNLSGRTHYVDPDTLRFHKAKITASNATCNGLLFWLVESVALDPDNRERGFRYVIFNLYGDIVGTRASLNKSDCYTSTDRARKAMYRELETLDAVALTREAIERARKYFESDVARIESDIARVTKAKEESR